MKWVDRPRSLFWRVWCWPVILAVLIMFGLLSALLGQDGVWHWLSWIALSIPLGVVIRFGVRAIPMPRTQSGRPRAGEITETVQLGAAQTTSRETAQ